MIKKEAYGMVGDKQVYKYTITNKNNNSLVVSDYGATILNLFINKNNRSYDVALGYNNLAGYFNNGEFIGCVVSPTCNRINLGRFEIAGVNYQMQQNDRGNNLHTHNSLGARNMIMDVQTRDQQIVFSCHFNDGLAGLPGEKDFKVSYLFDDDNQLIIDYEMITDKESLFNPTQHCYFNLNGHDSGSILKHKMLIKASNITEVNDTLIPTGKLLDVTGSPFDFRREKEVGQDADDVSLSATGGYDHNYALDNYDGSLKEVAHLIGDKSQIKMTILTQMPGLQVYGGNFLQRADGKNGATYSKNGGIALETQFYPDNINHPEFASSLIKAQQKKAYRTIYRFENI